jgi:hypothetical protein
MPAPPLDAPPTGPELVAAILEAAAGGDPAAAAALAGLAEDAPEEPADGE